MTLSSIMNPLPSLRTGDDGLDCDPMIDQT
jgi:hypothetical protein